MKTVVLCFFLEKEKLFSAIPRGESRRLWAGSSYHFLGETRQESLALPREGTLPGRPRSGLLLPILHVFGLQEVTLHYVRHLLRRKIYRYVSWQIHGCLMKTNDKLKNGKSTQFLKAFLKRSTLCVVPHPIPVFRS